MPLKSRSLNFYIEETSNKYKTRNLWKDELMAEFVITDVILEYYTEVTLTLVR